MTSHRGLLVLGLPLAAALALFAAALSRRDPSPKPAPPRPKAKIMMPAPERPAAGIPPKVAPPERVMAAGEDVQLRHSYQSFRMAIATRNDALQRVLEPVLARRREAALRLADADVAASRDERSREVALRTLDALRRQP